MARAGSPSVVAMVAGVVVAAIVVVGVLLTRPGSPAPPAPSTAQRQAAALETALSRPPGAAAVDVGAGRDLRGFPYLATVVTMQPSVTAEQVADVVVGLPAAVRRVGLPSSYGYRQLSFVTDAGARLTVAWQPQVDRDGVRRAAAGWLAAATAVGDQSAHRADVAAIVLSGGEITYRLGLGATRGRSVLATYRSAAAAVGSADPGGQVEWDVSGMAGPTALRLSTSGPIGAAEQAEWSALLAETRRLRGSLVASRLEVSFGTRVEAHLAVLAPDQIDDAGFVPATYGTDVWPAARPQLHTLSADTDHWSYFLSWARQASPASEQLLALLFGDQGTITDGTGKDRSPQASAGWADTLRGFLGTD